MHAYRTKSIATLEEKMKVEDEHSLRYRVLKGAKEFKTSWVDLGQALYAVWKDKAYKEWGFTTFDTYVAKEIGIRKQTAMKLLRSYYFLEKEEPQYLKGDFTDTAEAQTVPTYESIDVLRRAKDKKELDTEDYARLKKEILEDGKDVREARKELTSLIRQRKELDPDEVRKQRRLSTVKRLLTTLRSLKQEISVAKLVSARIIKEADALISAIESEINL